jgi:hypothetical protein
MSSGNTPRHAVRQVRRRRNSYRASIERRAAMAAGMIKESGWSIRQAAGAFCVNAAYLGLARQLNDDDRLKLARGELKLSALWRNYRQRLAESRACEAADARLDRLIARYGADRIMAALDRVTAPQRIAAE